MLKKILLVVALILVVAAGTVTYMYLKPTQAASQPIEAIPLVIESNDVTTNSTASTEAATTEIAVAESADTTNQASTLSLFTIVSAESEARFIIDEVLNGSPFTVVGTTDQVAGQLAVDVDNVEQTQIGIIQINARTLATDSDMRDRAISNRILYTNDYEYITFTPTEIIGLPESVSVGEQLSFQVVGDLTIRDVTQSVTFTMEVTAISQDRVEGTATTTVNYADFGLSIPNVPSVTGVADTVTLELDFAAESA